MFCEQVCKVKAIISYPYTLNAFALVPVQRTPMCVCVCGNRAILEMEYEEEWSAVCAACAVQHGARCNQPRIGTERTGNGISR